jgi:hypothetical protein
MKRLGPLRVALAALAALLVAAAPFAGASSTLIRGWALWPKVIAPALMPIVAQVLVLDMIMSRVIMAEKGEAERARARFVVRFELVLLVLLLTAWAPFLVALLRA